MMRWAKKAVLFALLSLLLASDLFAATTYWVAKTGNDANSCAAISGIADPGVYKLTVTSGMTCITPDAGDTLKIKAGTYAEAYYTIPLPNATSWTGAATITNSGSDVVIFSVGSPFQISGGSNYIIFNGLIWDGTLSTTAWGVTVNTSLPGNNHHRFTNIEIRNFTGIAFGGGDFSELKNSLIHDNGTTIFDNCIYNQSSDTLIERNLIYNCTGAGVQIYAATAPFPSRTIVRYNIIHDVTTGSGDSRLQGIILATGDNNQAYNNIVYHLKKAAATQGGIEASLNATNTKIYNNTTYDIDAYGIWCPADAGAGTIIKNNVNFTNVSGPIFNECNATVSTNLGTDPLFVNATALAAPTIGAPTVGGSVTLGTHSYFVVPVINGVDGISGTVSSVVNVTTSGTQTVPLSAIPLGPAGTTARKVFRTIAGNTGFGLFLATINDNTTTTFNDTIADASLGANNAAGGDFSLQDTSLAIDAGTVITGFNYNGPKPDIGAFETFTVLPPDAVETTSVVSIGLGTAFAPYTPTSGCTGWTLKKGGIAQTLTTCSYLGNGIYQLNCTACLAAGDAITVSLAAATLSDTINIGNTKVQKNKGATDVVIPNNIPASGCTGKSVLLLGMGGCY